MLNLSHGIGVPETMRVGAAAPFTPTSIAGLKLWLDGELSTIAQVANAVSQWNDISGQGNHATQGVGASQPLTNTSTINGKNAIDFDGANDFLNLPAAIRSLSAGPYTLFMVALSDVIGANQRIYNGTLAGTTTVTYRYISTNTLSYQSRTTLAMTNTTQTLNTSAHAMGFSRSGVNINPFYDGVAGTSGTNAEDVTPDNLGIGRDPVSTFDPLDGRIGMILAYDTALSSAQLNSLGAYAQTRWGTAWTGL